jgi:cytoskeleton protein RodZ
VETKSSGVGATLREAREKLGLSVADVSGSIKFATRQIEALEAGDFASLPETAFLRGFVRSYAKLLHLDPVALLAALPRAEAPAKPAETAMQPSGVPFPNVYSERKLNIVWLVAALIIAVTLALSAWMMSNSAPKPELQHEAGAVPENVTTQSIELPVPPAEAEAPGGEPAAQAEAAAPSAAIPESYGMIHMVFDRDSWVEVTDSSGDALMSKINLQGTEADLNGTPPFLLVIGEARNVHLYYKGSAIDLSPYTKIEVARLKLE